MVFCDNDSSPPPTPPKFSKLKSIADSNLCRLWARDTVQVRERSSILQRCGKTAKGLYC